MCILPNKNVNEGGNFTCAQGGCAECMCQLLRQYDYLIYLVIRCQCPGNVDYQDLRQVGRIGLWCAIQGFRPELGYAFSHYAGTVLRRQIWRVVKEDQKAQGWQEPERAGDSLAVVVEAWQQAQVSQAMEEELVCLPERMQRILHLYYGLSGQEPMTLAAIGRQLGLTRERIRQLRNAALLLLKLPALSIRLRGLCERDSQQDYRQARRENDAWLRRRRGVK